MAALELEQDVRETREAFVAAMGRAVTGVTVVTTAGPAGRFGQTVSAMCSVTADPPTLLVCINRRSPLAAAAIENGAIGVSVLAAGHVGVAQSFAGRPLDGDVPYDFDGPSWVGATPVLADASASFTCEVVEVADVGTHAILYGRVEASATSEAAALLYSQRAYGRPALAS